ncbi:tetraspanin-8 isoform X2 [Tachyglossus aculeatus]|uniref:tetraspanin-8 isoform X2 n=1 Tax=Tachyglossus aculeatus TaxID=9261 RepID=UPI0018F394A6|nr:tetraspanin-8 isoform X2 [Tachyglossus aculeatus]
MEAECACWTPIHHFSGEGRHSWIYTGNFGSRQREVTEIQLVLKLVQAVGGNLIQNIFLLRRRGTPEKNSSIQRIWPILKMAGVSGCIKYSMFIFNFFFWLCGSLILGVSVWLRVSNSGQEFLKSDVSKADLYPLIDLLIAVGTTIMILGFLGCCGAVRESKCMLALFFAGLLLILILQVVAGALAVTKRPEIEQAFNKTVEEKLPLLLIVGAESEKFQGHLKEFQKKYKCCGLVRGYEDWGDNFKNNYETCKCPLESKDTCFQWKEDIYIYKQSCRAAIMNYFQNNLIIVAGIAFGLAVVENALADHGTG